MLQGHLALRGNAYAQIDRKMGRPARLVPLHPDRVEVGREGNGELVYKINPESGSAPVRFCISAGSLQTASWG
jgi:phage portal protein BeeE